MMSSMAVLHPIRQRLLENKNLDLESAYSQAYSLDLVQRNVDAYASRSVLTAAAIAPQQPQAEEIAPQDQTLATAFTVNGSVTSVATLFITGKYIQQVKPGITLVERSDTLLRYVGQSYYFESYDFANE